MGKKRTRLPGKTFQERVANRLYDARDRAQIPNSEEAAKAIWKKAAKAPEFANRELKPSTYGKWETAEHGIPLNFIPFVADAFGVSVYDLIPPE